MDPYKVLDETFITEVQESHREVEEIANEFKEIVRDIDNFASKFGFYLGIDFENYEPGETVYRRNSQARRRSSVADARLLRAKGRIDHGDGVKAASRRNSFWLPTTASLRRRESLRGGRRSRLQLTTRNSLRKLAKSQNCNCDRQIEVDSAESLASAIESYSWPGFQHIVAISPISKASCVLALDAAGPREGEYLFCI